MKDIIFINSHPIQYFAPLYKYMNEKGIKTKAWYCSDESIRGELDRQFGTNVKWNIPLLEGYEYFFFKNYSWKPSNANGFFGLINFGMIYRLFKIPKSIIVVHGWHYLTHFIILILGKLKGHTICIRCEIPQNQEVLKSGWAQKIKKFGLKYLLFPRIDYFLYIGIQNKLFYKSYNLPDKKLLFCPYSVDNERFAKSKNQLSNKIQAIKSKLGIPLTHKIILYSGKYISKKRPLDILNAFKNINDSNCWLIMVGEGNMRPEIEKIIAINHMKNVILTGFINQIEIPEYYAISDVFIMCSSLGETWGLSVNEAMNFNLPVIVSSMTGCAKDLVLSGSNGYIFKTGDIQELSDRIKDILFANKLSWVKSSKDIIEDFSYFSITKNLAKIL